MYKRMNLQKIVLLLAVIFVASAAIVCFIFFAQYGFNTEALLPENKNIGINSIGLDTDTILSEDIKGGVRVDEERSEAIQDLKIISVETVSENISIVPVDTNDVKVHFYGTYISSNADFKPELTVSRSGDALKIKVEYKQYLSVSNFSSNLKLFVYIPKQYAGKLETISTSGDISTDSLILESFISRTTSGDFEAKLINAGTAEIDTTSGDAKINGIYDNFIFKSTSGNLVAGDFSAKITRIDSTSGDATISGTPGDINLTTVSGNLDLTYSSYSNKIDIKTTSGDTRIRLPENAGFYLDYVSTSGDAHCDFPITISGKKDGHRLRGSVGSGAGTINVSTVSGSLTIKK